MKLNFLSKKNKIKNIMKYDKKYKKYKIGNYTYGEPVIRFPNINCTLTIGSYTSIAEGVQIFLGGEHRMDWVTTFPLMKIHKELYDITGHPESKGSVIIGSDVWIGTDAFILSGVNIGDGAVVGARAVVTKNVEPYTIVCGNPARYIKHRFSKEDISLLTELKWWMWDEVDIINSGNLLLSSRIKELYEYAKSNNLIPR